MFDDCLIYKSEFNFQIIENKDTDAILNDFNTNYLSNFNQKSLAFLLDANREKFFVSGFDKAFAEHSRLAYNKIIEGKLVNGVKMMKGTGYGLTPSGDDFNTGLLYGSSINEQIYKQDLNCLRRKILEIGSGNNQISNSMLYYAYMNRYNKRLKELMTALFQNPDKLEQTFNEYIKTGETSGADLLTGFITAIKYKIGL